MATEVSRASVVTGARDASGAALAYLAVAMSFGVLAASSGLPHVATIGLSAAVYAGASQFALVQGLAAHHSPELIAAEMLLMNLRHVPMGLSTPETSHRFRLVHRLLLAGGLTDESFALSRSNPGQPFSYYVGLYGTCWAAWVGGTGLGCVVGPRVPDQWFAFTLPALFISLVVDSLRDYPARTVPLLLAVGVGAMLVAEPVGPARVPLTIALVVPVFHHFGKQWSSP
jgi:predicted branched-subunit amino acid permease